MNAMDWVGLWAAIQVIATIIGVAFAAPILIIITIMLIRDLWKVWRS